MDEKTRKTIIQAYGRVLEASSKYTCGKERDLPFPKKLIRQALAEAILMGKHDQNFRNILGNLLLELETFIPDAEFEQIKTWEDTLQKGQETVKKAKNPNDAAKEVAELIVKTNLPEQTQLDILKRTERRLEQIQAMKGLSSIWEE
jgi:hypothetical protein